MLLDDLDFPYYPSKGKKGPQVHFASEDYPLAAAEPAEEAGAADVTAPRDFALVRPAAVEVAFTPATRPARASYSYTSLAAELHAEAEDRAGAPAPADESEEISAPAATEDEQPSGAPATPASAADGDPTALGSAFHALAQWLVETGEDTVPAPRADAQCRYWKVTERQRERLDAALRRWEHSAVRAEVRAWACLRAEVPFFSQGMDELAERFGAYAEGAIDLLATDPARPGEALVIDYKTGGSASETPEALHEKHHLQADVYADVLHKAGYGRVTLKFVRVEIDDPEHPGEPQVVTYER